MPTGTSVTDRESPARPRARCWLIACAAIAGVLLLLFFLPRRVSPPAAVIIGNTTLELEVARTPEEYARGLSGRRELPGDGMLFLFGAPQPRVFWMRGMRFPIDIVWIRGAEVVGLAARVPPPPAGTPDEELERFSSPGPVDRVLELSAGRAEELGIAPGQRVRILLP